MNDIPISANGGSGTSAPFGDLEALNLAVVRGGGGGAGDLAASHPGLVL